MAAPGRSGEEHAQEPTPGRLVTVKDGAALWIVFDNPARVNALNTVMWAALPELIHAAVADDEVRVLVLRGAGERAFSAGADISEFEKARTGAEAKRYDALNHAALNALTGCAKPTIAMIQGYCLGGGLEIALCCDLRLAAAGSSFAIPAAKLGIGYDPRWMQPLFGAVSVARAKEILFTGRRFSHAEALAMGLVNQIHGAQDIETATRALAQEIASNAPLSIRAAKATIDALTRRSGDVDLVGLDRMVEACLTSEDYAEGRTAFMEKRKPAFKGR